MTFARLVDGAEAAVKAALSGAAEGIAVATSGSTGTAREVLLETRALVASAEATHARLTGPGRWLLALPTDRIAGAQVLARSVLAGTAPVAIGPGPFTAERFAAATSALVEGTPVGVPLYASLVPTQWRRLAQDRSATGALRAYAAILVGGAALGAGPRTSTVVATYGATETAGGCVYDGLPLNGVHVDIDTDGVVLIGGPTLARGYADGRDGGFVARGGERWWRSADMGEIRDGRLVIAGRADDVIVTGGHKVHPGAVEEAVCGMAGVEACVVVGVPDAEWGDRVVALVVHRQGEDAPTVEGLRLALHDRLPRHAIPRDILVAASLPTLTSGKIDRVAARHLATQARDNGEGER